MMNLRAVAGAVYTRLRSRLSGSAFWSAHNVTGHRRFATREASLKFCAWRNAQCLFRERYMPIDAHGGKDVLDFGCGPGNDLVNLLERSAPRRLVGADIAATSLREARGRLALHPGGDRVELVTLDENQTELPFADASFDYVHCDGVIHHTAHPEALIAEFKRILRPAGEARIYAYHYDSVFIRLSVAFEIQVLRGKYRDLSAREAFARVADGGRCPIANCYTREEFLELCRDAGAPARVLGIGATAAELRSLPLRMQAICDRRLPAEHRDFLRALTFDAHGLPCFDGAVAGIAGFYALRK